MLQLLPSLLQPLPLWDPLALVLELQLEMEPKTFLTYSFAAGSAASSGTRIGSDVGTSF